MVAARRWDRASLLPTTADGSRHAEIVQLEPAEPDVATLFTFMRDAELRFATLRLRLEERTSAATGDRLRIHEIVVRHPGHARVTMRVPETGTYETWSSDGATIRTWRSAHHLATTRPARPRLVGLEDPDLPGTSRAYRPVTALPSNGLADTFVHPAGLCQNVLATGTCSIAGTARVADREAIVLRCDRPRTIELPGDRPDHRLELGVDRETGLVVALVESFGTRVTRDVIATEVTTDAPVPDSAFVISVPSDAATIY